MHITIKDIAREARVSYATVSRALNNVYGVHPATQARILEIARRLDYRPNGIARGLVMKQTKTIGLVIPDITNPFFPEVARGAEEGALELGYSVILCNTNWERERERSYVELLAEKRADGILIAPISNVIDPALEHVFGTIPVVYVSNAPRNTERSFVAIDDNRGGFLATQHLIEAGYRRIGFVGATGGSPATDERLEGYKRALAQHGLPIEQRYIHLDRFKQESAARIIRSMIERRDFPEAIFAENDLLALGVIQGAREMGLSVPRDIAVVGFDDIPFAAYREVQLTTVYQPKYEMGRTAAKMLLEEIAADATGPSSAVPERAATGIAGPAANRTAARCADEEAPLRGRHVILEPELIVRATSRAGVPSR